VIGGKKERNILRCSFLSQSPSVAEKKTDLPVLSPLLFLIVMEVTTQELEEFIRAWKYWCCT